MFQAFDMTNGDVVMTVFPIFGRTGFAWVIGAMLYGVPNGSANFEASNALRRNKEFRARDDDKCSFDHGVDDAVGSSGNAP